MQDLHSHILKLNGLRPDSRRLATAFDADHKPIAQFFVTAEDCYCTSSCPSYWSLGHLARYAATLGIAGLAWVGFAPEPSWSSVDTSHDEPGDRFDGLG